MPQLDISTYSSQIFWLLICFFSMYFIMAKIVIPRISGIIGERQNKIDTYLNKAQAIQKQAEAALEKYQQALDHATTEAEKSLAQTEAELNAFLKQKQNELDKSLQKKLSQSEASINKNKEQALSQIQEVSESLALNIVKKIGLNEIGSKEIKTAAKKVEKL